MHTYTHVCIQTERQTDIRTRSPARARVAAPVLPHHWRLAPIRFRGCDGDLEPRHCWRRVPFPFAVARMDLPPPSSQPQQQSITMLGSGAFVYSIDPDEGQVFHWSCKYLSREEVIVEQKGDLYKAGLIWNQCIEKGLWEDFAGERYIVRDFVYRPSDFADFWTGTG